MEKWLDIVGYEGKYKVSDNGRIKSYLTSKKGILRKISDNGYGYMFLALCKNGVKKKHRVHRLVTMAFIPNLENKPCINHINGIKSDNSVQNLEWCTHSANNKHAYEKGLNNTIGNKHASFVTANEIRRKKATTKISQRELAKQFCICESSISKIINYKTHKQKMITN
jgi:hypothetical protein